MRIIRLVVLNSGKIRVMFGGVVGLTYDSWKHWFAAGPASYADDDLILAHAVRGIEWADD